MLPGRLYLLLISTLLFIPASSQLVKHLKHTSYNVNEGLLHNQVISMAEDGNGFIWISSGSGVQRFDGKNFIQVTASAQKGGLPDDKQVELFSLESGNVLFSHSKGFSEYDIQTDRFRDVYSWGKIQSGKTLTPLMEIKDGVWCYSSDGGFYLLKYWKNIFSDSFYLPPIVGSMWTVPLPSRNGSGFFAGFNDHMVTIVGRDFFPLIHRTDPSMGKVISLADYKPDTLLVATQKGIWKMDIQSGTMQFYYPYQTTSAELATRHYIKLYGLRDGKYLLSEGRNIYELNPENPSNITKLVNLQNQDLINIGFIQRYYSDSRNNFWIISENDGIIKVEYRSSEVLQETKQIIQPPFWRTKIFIRGVIIIVAILAIILIRYFARRK